MILSGGGLAEASLGPAIEELKEKTLMQIARTRVTGVDLIQSPMVILQIIVTPGPERISAEHSNG
jgi:hypothetical protein